MQEGDKRPSALCERKRRTLIFCYGRVLKWIQPTFQELLLVAAVVMIAIFILVVLAKKL